MKFLVVDDSSTMRRMVKKYLNRLGYNNITEAGNGKEALEHVSGSDFIFY